MAAFPYQVSHLKSHARAESLMPSVHQRQAWRWPLQASTSACTSDQSRWILRVGAGWLAGAGSAKRGAPQARLPLDAHGVGGADARVAAGLARVEELDGALAAAAAAADVAMRDACPERWAARQRRRAAARRAHLQRAIARRACSAGRRAMQTLCYSGPCLLGYGWGASVVRLQPQVVLTRLLSSKLLQAPAPFAAAGCGRVRPERSLHRHRACLARRPVTQAGKVQPAAA